jgi:hypothetical protein
MRTAAPRLSLTGQPRWSSRRPSPGSSANRLRKAEFPDWSGIEAWLTQFVTGHFAAQRYRLGPILALKER